MSHRWAQRSPRWGETELERRVGGRHLEPFELRRGHRRRTSRKSVRGRHFYTCTSNKPRDVLALLLRCFVRFERYRHRCPACSARYFASFQLHASADNFPSARRVEHFFIPHREPKGFGRGRQFNACPLYIYNHLPCLENTPQRADCSDERTPPSTSPRPRHGGHRRPKGAGRNAPGVPASGELRLTPLGATSARRGITFPRPRLEALILRDFV